jgi:hypothetical protein
MIQAGVPIPEVARFLGNSEKMVERVYGRNAPDDLRRAAAALAGAPETPGRWRRIGR